MKPQLTKIFATGLVATGLMFAQPPEPAPAPQTPATPGGRVRRPGRMMQRLAQVLNLTPDQKAQAKTIFQSARGDAKPLAAQMRDTRLALANAVKVNAPASQIDQLSSTAGALAGQLTAIRTKAFEKFYTILTPDQKDKLNTVMNQFLKVNG